MISLKDNFLTTLFFCDEDLTNIIVLIKRVFVMNLKSH